MKSLLRLLSIVALVALTFASQPLARADAAPTHPTFTARNATEAVFYAHGMLDAETELAALLALPANQRLFSFRQLAGFNVTTAMLMEGLSPTAAAFFWGRASAFDQVADLFGEP
jgi:hypothetical protein